MLRFFVGIAWFFSLILTAQAETRFSGDVHRIELTGTITERDAKAFSAMADKFAIDSPMVWLDSMGGDVFAAMKIGRIIRQYEGFTIISFSKCYSSCALVFIAGSQRMNGGELGLHRPYLGGAPQSREMIEEKVPLILSAVKSYVAEMGITDSFYEKMINTEPSKVIVYRGWNETEKIIPGDDPVYEEITTSINARKYGITTSEVRTRK
jgi:hypothetical protein